MTHVHGDHSGGAESLSAETGAKIYAGKSDTPVLKAGAPFEAIFSTFHMPNHKPHPTTVDVALDGDETVAIGDVRFHVLDTPGHTLGSTCYLMETGGHRTLFAGDVIQRLGKKPFGTYSAYLPPRYRGDARLFLASLQKLRAIPVPDLVLPGHPRSSLRPASPRLTQSQWEEMLETGIDEMFQLVDRFESDGASFLDGQPKQLLSNFYYFGDFHESAIYGFFVDSKFFVIDAPGGPGLADFLKSRQRKLGLIPTEPTAILLTACGHKETAGLKELVERSHAIVVAGSLGVNAVRQICGTGTTVIPTEELTQRDWFLVEVISLGGRSLAPIVYIIPSGEKNVLLSGRVPEGMDRKTQGNLLSDLANWQQTRIDFLTAIEQRTGLRPDLWLPAVPSNGQNANFYDTDWRDVDQNYRGGF